MEYPAPPYRIKMVEPIRLLDAENRIKRIKEAEWNLFNLNAEDIYLDFLTDSGTGAMSQEQWSAMMMGDESYANARSFRRFERVVQQFTGLPEVIPTHQGRAAENVLLPSILKEGKYVVSNQSFDTTVGHILFNGREPYDIVIDEGLDPVNEHLFKGNMNTTKLKSILDGGLVSMVTLVLTNNAGGGQPVSLANISKVAEIVSMYDVPFFLDIARIVENSYFIKEREHPELSIAEIVRRTCLLADGVWMSAKKDAYVNIGGFIALKDSTTADKLRERLVLFEGFPSYGGLAGRDLEAIATGLEQVTADESIVKHRIQQVSYLHAKLTEIGIPLVNPPGGHAIFIDAKQFLPHIPPEQFPAQALACQLYIEGGIRSVEIGSLMFGREEDGKFIPANMELVRLAIPRRVYEQGHFDYVVSVMNKLMDKKDSIRGMKIIEEPEILRHFTCKLDTL